MTWRDQPAIKAGIIGGEKPVPAKGVYASDAGGFDYGGESERSKYYANPPSNPGFNGLQLGTSPWARRGACREGVVSTSSTFARKGMPFS